MKAITHTFKDLENRRYLITTYCNDNPFEVNYYSVAVSSKMEPPELNPTYHELDAGLQTYLGLASGQAASNKTAVQQLRNFRSTLNGFLASVGKTTDSRVGAELTTRFDECLSHYITLLDVAESTKRDRRSHMNRYREIFSAQQDKSTQKPVKKTALSESLREAIARKGVAPKTLARSINVSPSAVQRYLSGATPNVRGIPGLRRLEAALGLERDSLTALVNDDTVKEGKDSQKCEYGKRLSQRCADKYFLSVEEIPKALENEWRQFLSYKTAITPTLERSARGVWRCIPESDATIDSPLLKVGRMVCPTAKIALDRIRALLGYLRRPADQGGQGIPSECLVTLAWLAVPSAITGYLEFLTERSEGLVHSGQQNFARLVASLVRPKTGYLRQRPELRKSLLADVRPQTAEEWDRMCDSAHRIAKLWIQRATDMSRNPDTPIASLLALEHPLEPVISGIEELQCEAAKAMPGSIGQARHKRDALLLAFVISNPLRLRSLQSLTWSPDNTGSVYKTSEGWRVRLSRSMLKNGRGKAGKNYDVAVSNSVGEMIDEYVEEYRATLLEHSKSKYFFVSNKRGKPWKDMSRHVSRLTQRHVAGTDGFGLHAFRHLVATDLLKRCPNAFVTAAVLLNDSVEIVMRSYVHLQRDDSFVLHHKYLEGLCQKSNI